MHDEMVKYETIWSSEDYIVYRVDFWLDVYDSLTTTSCTVLFSFHPTWISIRLQSSLHSISFLLHYFQVWPISWNCTQTVVYWRHFSRVIKFCIRRFGYGDSHKIALHFMASSVSVW